MPENGKGILTKIYRPWEKLYPFVVVIEIKNNPTFLIQTFYNMKKFAPLPFLVLFILFYSTARSQDCSKYLFLQQNKTIEITIYNKKSEPTGKQVYTVSNVSNSGGATSATLNSQLFDKKGRSTVGASSTIKCTGGIFQVDMKLMIPQGPAERMNNAQVTGGNGILEYPTGMKPGDTLKSGSLVMTTSSNGPSSGPPGPPAPPSPFSQGSTLTMSIFDRKVLGQDTVTTTAGSWSCIKIAYKSKVNLKSGPFPTPTVNIDGTEWYAPGVGIIKTESQHGSTAITSIK